MTLTPETPLLAVKGIGPARSGELGAAGYRTVGDLLFHLPHRYEDRRALARIGDLQGEGVYTFSGHLREVRRIRSRRRRPAVVRGILVDGSGRLPVVWFNRPYLPRWVDEGEEYLLCGPVRGGPAGRQLINPTCERAAEALHSGRVVGVYPALGKIGPAALRRILARILGEIDPAAAVGEPLPREILEPYGMPPVGAALAALHRPGESADVEALNRRRSPAHLRLIYGEFLELQLELALLRQAQVRVAKDHRYRVDDRLRRRVKEILPFRLTGAQKSALREIVEDLESPYPMLRLLQGDVGSGKTIVAALALVTAMESGLQGAFMAPTELLAEQHHRNLRHLLGERYRLGLLTASAPGVEEARRDLAAGRIQLAVGTHALIQEGVDFRRLGLAVVDEQHRFGVAQRRDLQRKGRRPDLLVMTATPIPRSLALTVYGDLELSVIDEMPPGRRPVATQVVPASRRREVYGWLEGELAGGAQAYVVFPLIEDSERVAAASLEEMGAWVRQRLAAYPSAVVHGRTPPAERERVMRAFGAGEVRVLVATTVIEVGVDVPGATAMVIESAERFGLAQLHQLRGRVGRGGRPARCVALHGRHSGEARRRLEVFTRTSDGFEIADADLEIRGPGDLLGTRQAGLPRFRAARLLADREWLERARADARQILPRLASAGYEMLRRRLEERLAAGGERFAGG